MLKASKLHPCDDTALYIFQYWICRNLFFTKWLKSTTKNTHTITSIIIRWKKESANKMEGKDKNEGNLNGNINSIIHWTLHLPLSVLDIRTKRKYEKIYFYYLQKAYVLGNINECMSALLWILLYFHILLCSFLHINFSKSFLGDKVRKLLGVASPFIISYIPVICLNSRVVIQWLFIVKQINKCI